MSTSDRTLNQVRAILTKLDRSIDEAREKRTHTPTATPPTPPPVAAPGGPAPQASAPVAAPVSGSPYGRAQPMPKAQSANMLRWKS